MREKGIRENLPKKNMRCMTVLSFLNKNFVRLGPSGASNRLQSGIIAGIIIYLGASLSRQPEGNGNVTTRL